MDRDTGTRRLRLAELTSSVGAGVLGLGLGIVAREYLARAGWPLLVLGLVVHAWGMMDKRRLEARMGAPDVWWSTVLYWTCWVLLGSMLVYVLVE